MDEEKVGPQLEWDGDHGQDPRVRDLSRHQHEWPPPWEPPAPPTPSVVSALLLPLGLFLVTVFTTLWAGAYLPYSQWWTGAYQVNQGPVRGAWDLLVNHTGLLYQGLPFAGTLLGILVTHELGHYLLSRIHRVPASLPFFIPGPPQAIGTFGAIIRLRFHAMNRRALFDIGVAGPIAGFVVAVFALIIGLSLSTVVPKGGVFGVHLGEPLLLQFFAWLILGPVSASHEVVLHPVAFAAWVGFLVTALNLIPIGQLDGGHVGYALFGPRQRKVAFAIIPILLVLGLWGWPGWILWASLPIIFGISHPPVIDPGTELGRGRIWVAWGAVAIFILSFTPVPIYVG